MLIKLIAKLKRRHDTQYNDTQHNINQYNDSQHNINQYNDTQNNDSQYKDIQHRRQYCDHQQTLFNRYAECHYTECRGAVLVWQLA